MTNEEVYKYINSEQFHLKRGNIVWADLPTNRGNVQYGRRKVVIVSNNYNNYYGTILQVVPLTSKNKKFKLHIHRSLNDYFCPEQLQAIDKSCVLDEIIHETASEEQMKMLDDLILVQLNINNMDYKTIKGAIRKYDKIGEWKNTDARKVTLEYNWRNSFSDALC